MFKWQKIRKDRETLRAYEISLQNEKKHYMQTFEAVSETGRKNRALCIGECCLQAMEKLNELVNRQPPVQFVKGSLFWNLGEQRVKDEDGEKGFRYSVTFHVQSYERRWTDEEIKEKLMEAAKRIGAETDEMFRKEALEEDKDE